MTKDKLEAAQNILTRISRVERHIKEVSSETENYLGLPEEMFMRHKQEALSVLHDRMAALDKEFEAL